MLPYSFPCLNYITCNDPAQKYIAVWGLSPYPRMHVALGPGIVLYFVRRLNIYFSRPSGKGDILYQRQFSTEQVLATLKSRTLSMDGARVMQPGFGLAVRIQEE